MRKLTVVAAAIACMAISSTAMANSGTVKSGTGVGTVQGGKNNSSQQYKSVYTDPVLGPVACAGVHQVSKNTTALGQDSFTCTSTTGAPVTNVSPGDALTLATVGAWLSDYYILLGQTVLATSLTVTVSLDGMSYTGVAVY